MNRVCAAFFLGLLLLTTPARSEDFVPPFAPPSEYVSTPGKPFDSLLNSNIKWTQAKITDRKRRRRYQENQLRLPNGEDKRPVQAALDKVNGELKEATAALAVLTARKPDVAAQRELVKSTVTEWIKVLNEKVETLRKDAAEADARAKNAERRFDAARAQADAYDYRQNADKTEKEAKALAQDLAAAGL